jgi:hypothetical protein
VAYGGLACGPAVVALKVSDIDSKRIMLWIEQGRGAVSIALP